MELLSLVAIIAIAIVSVIGVISFVRNISAYYRDRFRFSIWSGVFILLLAIALLILAGSSSTGTGVFIVELIAAGLAALVIYKDVRLAGFGWGVLAVGLQVLFAVSFLFMLTFLLIGYFIRRIFYPRRSVFFPSLGMALGMNGEISFLLNFLRF